MLFDANWNFCCKSDTKNSAMLMLHRAQILFVALASIGAYRFASIFCCVCVSALDKLSWTFATEAGNLKLLLSSLALELNRDFSRQTHLAPFKWLYKYICVCLKYIFFSSSSS